MASDIQRSSNPASARAKSKGMPRLTCVNCRTRKIKCDGGQPECGVCLAYGKQCHYDKPPSLSQAIAMTQKIQELEKTIENLQRNSPRTHDQSNTGDVVDGEVSTDGTGYQQESMSGIETDMNAADAYYNTTSAVDAPQSHETNTQTSGLYHEPHTSHDVEMLDQEAIASWEENAIENCAVLLGLPSDKVRHLLTIHWTWVHPAFIFIDKALFLRDGATGGEYFSLLLLNVICLHSTRFTDHELTERLLAQSKVLLSHEIHREPTIPRVQALLQLSAREIGRGATSQAWTYSGMAFRSAIDLGLFNDKSHSGAKKDDLRRNRIGHRLAWSCYLWDKTMSLYLGRSPTLLAAPSKLPTNKPISETSSKWMPYGLTENMLYNACVPSQIEACFFQFCKLAIIITDILQTIYGTKSTQHAAHFVKTTRDKLLNWYRNLPTALQMSHTPVICPSPHILTQNLLYHATTILLLRPFRRVRTCRDICRTAADAIQALFICLENSFGLSRVTYLQAYCAYTAATVAVQDVKDRLEGAQAELNTFIRVLSAVRSSCPGIQRSLDVIAQCTGPDSDSSRDSHEHFGFNADSTQQPGKDIMPVFPVHDMYFGSFMNNDHAGMPFDLDSYNMQWSEYSEDIFGDFSL